MKDINIKVIIASSLLAGTSAIADFSPDDGVVTGKVCCQSPILIGEDIAFSGRKSLADNETNHSSVERQKVSYQLSTFDIEDTDISGRK